MEARGVDVLVADFSLPLAGIIAYPLLYVTDEHEIEDTAVLVNDVE